MKRVLLFASAFISTMASAQDCSDLIISEYVEGWSNNKAIELYNPTSSAIDLSEYMIVRYSNGSTTATSANAVQLTGTIAAQDAYVAVLEKLDSTGMDQNAPIWDDLQAKADGFYCPEYNVSNAFYWNGNDAIALAKGTVNDVTNAQLIDLFGKIGEDPGEGWTTEFPYTSGGVVVTKDHSLIRKSTVLTGVTNPNISFFDPLLEYDSIPPVIEVGGLTEGNWSSLGEHACDCPQASTDELHKNDVSIYPNPTNGTFVVNGVASFENIDVVNALGQTVQTIRKNSNAIVSFDLNDNRGVYFVRMTNGSGQMITKRVIVK